MKKVYATEADSYWIHLSNKVSVYLGLQGKGTVEKQ